MMAEALAENGAAAVYIVGRREDKLREAAARYPRYPEPYTTTAQSCLSSAGQIVRIKV